MLQFLSQLTLLLMVALTFFAGCKNRVNEPVPSAANTTNEATADSSSFWLLVENKASNTIAYVNAKGDTMIPPGKYAAAFTDTFRNFAIVYMPDNKFVGIDKQEKVLFEVYPYDNGPDYPSNGLFRITENGKIGYANLNGSVVIQPQFHCAYPFENKLAKVSLECNQQTEGEHTIWQSNNWFYIDTKGNKAKPPQ